jgi:hypothetical protein
MGDSSTDIARIFQAEPTGAGAQPIVSRVA